MSHIVEMQESFLERFKALTDSGKSQVLEILTALERDPFFLPDAQSFKLLSDPETGTYYCQRTDWDGWALVWRLEYSSEPAPASPPDAVLVSIILDQRRSDRTILRDAIIEDTTRSHRLSSEAFRLMAGSELYLSKPISEDNPNLSYVRVFYATDRNQRRKLNSEPEFERFRSPNGQLHYGQCAISIPKVHRTGKLETPSLLKLEFSPNPKKHIVLVSIESLEERVFLERVSDAVAKSPTREAFVFIHGYNVSFEDAARRTGQLAFDLQFVGAPIFYSWPSNGQIADYLKDETNVYWTVPHFKRFLQLLSAHSGAARLHLIAHSMGNRAVCDALKEFSYRADNGIKLNHLVLAAPDIDADTFRELAVTLQEISQHVTLYQSSRDKAILASKKIHGNPRAAEPILVVAGMDTVDASAIDTDFLGHSYFSDNWPLLSDIHALIGENTPVQRRFGLIAKDSESGTYHAFRA
jgi:esterase/lipase superfamily enzyme